jgi:hypothetical protein
MFDSMELEIANLEEAVKTQEMEIRDIQWRMKELKKRMSYSPGERDK